MYTDVDLRSSVVHFTIFPFPRFPACCSFVQRTTFHPVPSTKNPFPMKRLSTLLCSGLFTFLCVNAQYCSPTFANGCFGWQITDVSVGNDFNWSYTDCTDWDQTATMITVNSADSIAMSVTDGVWSGCAVWVDWDNSGSFEEVENLYHIYVGADPSYTYNFNIGIPLGTADGTYRMRIIGAWGSDGFTVGSGNGFGPCGSFQYGNFNDFTLNVDNSTAVTERNGASSSFTASPNPTTGRATLHMGNSNAKDVIVLEAMDGRMIHAMHANGATTMTIDLSDVPDGIYFIRNTSDNSARPLRIVKQ